MYPIEPEVSKSRIEKLENILGKEWLESQLAEYRDFREQYSPADLWSHRHPTTSTIVSLLFHYHHGDQAAKRGAPFGHWHGNPLHSLMQIAGAIYFFESYWSAIPGHLLTDHFRRKLSTAEHFNSFLFELLVAIDNSRRYGGFDVHPLFLDPATAKGGQEIILRKGSEEIDIRCSTISPVAALGMSFDTFQYLFGCFYRLVQDSGYSYKLSMNLKGALESADAEALLDPISEAVRSGFERRSLTKTALHDAELLRLNVPREGLSLAEINGLMARDTGDLLVEIGGGNPGGERKAIRVAVLSVSAAGYKLFGDQIIEAVGQAAREARPNASLVLAIHLQRYVGWGEYLGNPTHRLELRQKLEGILGRCPTVKYVDISSNRHEFVVLPSDAQRVDTHRLEVTNRHFVDKPKPKIYVRKGSFTLHPGNN